MERNKGVLLGGIRVKELPLKVSEERWKKAQAWELRYWQQQHHSFFKGLQFKLRRPLQAKKVQHDDWNFWWASKFEDYQVIPNNINNAIELGCGPYTNIRLVAKGRQIIHTYCNDPLTMHYIHLKRGWLSEAYKKGLILLDDHPIEEMPYVSKYFDLVLMINVLDHVNDALLCIRQAKRITKRGGYLVIGQDLSSMEDVENTGDDTGHPIRIDHVTLDEELLTHFRPHLYRILDREDGRNPPAHYGTYIFIGEKFMY